MGGSEAEVQPLWSSLRDESVSPPAVAAGDLESDGSSGRGGRWGVGDKGRDSGRGRGGQRYGYIDTGYDGDDGDVDNGERSTGPVSLS